MDRQAISQTLVLVLIAFSLDGCGGRKKCLSVSEIWEDAGSLEGERICVRGRADFRLSPYHPMQVGGCIPMVEGETRPRVSGRLTLVDEDSPDPRHRLSVSESSLQCEGDVCSATCEPFAPSAQATWGGTETIEAFQFVGMLRVDREGGDVELVLEDIDLRASWRLADGEWERIPAEDVVYAFP